MPTTKTRKPKTKGHILIYVQMREKSVFLKNCIYGTLMGRQRRNILTFKRYANRRDLLSVLLKDGEEYTMEQVDSLLQNFFKKGKVN